MLHIALLISKLILRLFISAALILGMSGCASIEEDTPEAFERTASKQKVFFASFDQVWRAVHTTLKYPIANENADTGMVETEIIKGADGWIPPDSKKPASAGTKYRLIFIIAKGKAQGHHSTRVTIEKKIEVQKDFFAESQTLETDGLEEKILFYRIERELIIQQALKKAG